MSRKYGYQFRRNKSRLKDKLKGTVCLKCLAAHHILPLSRGGEHTLKNMCLIKVSDHRKLHKFIEARPHMSIIELQRTAEAYGAYGVWLK